jgi:hypothetical protein
MVLRVLLTVLVAVTMACRTEDVARPPADGRLALGTWGGDSAGVIVNDTLTHVHIGCTYGDIPGRITLDAEGRFTRTGSYLLRAYPVAQGPTLPAQFVGRVLGSTLTITVTITDTINNQVVVRGPSISQLGVPPRMANCPICRVPGDRMSAMRPYLLEVPLWYGAPKNNALGHSQLDTVFHADTFPFPTRMWSSDR